MTFVVADNNIKVTASNGDVVFDTATPMPHIAQVITTTITHTFPESGDTTVERNSYFVSDSFNCRYYEYVCGQQYVCGYDAFGNYSCGYEWVCGWEYVYYNEYSVIYSNRVEPLDHSQVYTLGTLQAGTSPDFVLATITASRTVTGSQQDFGPFVSAIPTGQKMAANGSTLLEIAHDHSGNPWLSRIVSIYLDGDTVKAEFKHSNRQFLSEVGHTASACKAWPTYKVDSFDNTSSKWQITFEVYAGKFTL